MATLDTLQDAVNVLTTSTTTLVTEVQTKKAVLDAAVDDAQGAQTAAQAARDTANLHKLAAETAATTATSIASSLAGFDLESIAEAKAVTAVDVFVYDTSRDSDGGAWRKRTQHTSWYNETLDTATRGARREFPAVAVIVAEAAKVTIYDGDDPSLPMWMVFDGYINGSTGDSTVRGISMLNGEMNVATNGASNDYQSGLPRVRFVKDVYSVNRGSILDDTLVSDGQILNRNVSAFGPTYATGQRLVSGYCNDVAMTVLPDAPIDPATGLPVPTIAVATAGGVSVIKDDGTVASDSQPVSVQQVAILRSDLFSYIQTSTGYIAVRRNFYTRTGVSVDNFGLSSGGEVFYRHNSVPALFPTQANNAILKFDNKDFGFNQGLFRLHEDPTTPSKGMVAYTTSTYNTGWMNGAIKGAFLSDTDDTDLVASGELVTNGTFDTDLTGWTAVDANASVSSGQVTVANSTTSVGSLYQAITTEVGKVYQVTADYISTTATSAWLTAGTAATGAGRWNIKISQNSGASKQANISFVAVGTTTYIHLLNNSVTSGQQSVWDNISVKLADADRSVNNKGLIVNGTVTRTPVATGADLMAYSGFSASNYLYQPHNSDLSFGASDDFSIIVWVKAENLTGGNNIIDWGDGSSNSNRWVVYEAGGVYAFYDAGVVRTTSISSSASWTQLAFVRQSGVLKLYGNGVLNATYASTASYDNSDCNLYVGTRQSLEDAWEGSLALLRISATAPTAEQIAKIYNDERFLFQENAQATLYGASDAVTALAFDDTTQMLHVGTSAGRSVFSGLRRASNTTTAVGTAISASNSLVVEE